MKVLLINPYFTQHLYGKTLLRFAIFRKPVLSLAAIASTLIQGGHKVKILDLDLPKINDNLLCQTIKEWKPSIVGITGTTPLYSEMIRLSRIVKNVDSSATVIVGGHHATACPESFMKVNSIDIVVLGEGDFSFLELVSGKNLCDIKGIYYKNNNEIKHNSRRELIANLDNLPFPAWNLYRLNEYRSPRIIAKAYPCGSIETSRGCPYNCIYCSKVVFGNKFRTKSPDRVVDEMEYMIKIGFKEIHIQDDGFSIDLDRAKKICDLILRRNLRFPWVLFNGIRADNIDFELLHKLKEAGCYRISLGIESGDQHVLNLCRKGITIGQIKRIVRLIKSVGLETFGFFMIGLPGESRRSLEKTIDFAKGLNLDLYKFALTIPYPGTLLYEEWDREGYIKSPNWSHYFFHNSALDKKIFDHPNLDWCTLHKYYKKAYRKIFFNLPYVIKTLRKRYENNNCPTSF